MKTKLLLGLAFLATLGMTSCKKDKPKEPTSVKIGNKDYAIVKIGNQTWTTENYSGEGGIYYQENDVNKTEYGKFYTIEEAKAITPPTGWRLPTKEDFKKLFEGQGVQFGPAAEGSNRSNEVSLESLKKLMATTGWKGDVQGTNTSGFTGIPTGYKYGSDFVQVDESFVFWTSSSADDKPYFFAVLPEGGYYALYRPLAEYGICKFSVRFVKDN